MSKRMLIGTSIGLCLLVVIVLIAGIAGSYRRLDPGNVGILIDYSAASQTGQPVVQPLNPGQYVWVGPFSGRRLIEYPVAQQSLVLSSRGEEGEFTGDSTIPCYMSGGGTINIGLTLNWQVNQTHPETIYFKRPDLPLTSSLNNDIASTIVYGIVKADTIAACTNYSWQDVMGDGTGPSKRSLLHQDIFNAIQSDLATNGLVANQLSLSETRPDSTIQAVLNAKNKAQQSAYLKGDAQNQADAQRIKAQADADQIRIINEQLSHSPDYIQYLEIKEWDGHLPQYLSTDGKGNPIISALGGK